MLSNAETQIRKMDFLFENYRTPAEVEAEIKAAWLVVLENKKIFEKYLFDHFYVKPEDLPGIYAYINKNLAVGKPDIKTRPPSTYGLTWILYFESIQSRLSDVGISLCLGFEINGKKYPKKNPDQDIPTVNLL